MESVKAQLLFGGLAMVFKNFLNLLCQKKWFQIRKLTFVISYLFPQKVVSSNSSSLPGKALEFFMCVCV